MRLQAADLIPAINEVLAQPTERPRAVAWIQAEAFEGRAEDDAPHHKAERAGGLQLKTSRSSSPKTDG